MQRLNVKWFQFVVIVLQLARAARRDKTDAKTGKGCKCINPRDLPNLKDGLKYSFVKCDKPYKDDKGECLVADMIDCGANNDENGHCLFPGDFGGSCKKHAEPTDLCYDTTTGEPLPEGKRAKFCDLSWCFVDVCTCKEAAGTPESDCCTGALGTNKSDAAMGVFYSYTNCEKDDHYTEDHAVKSPHCSDAMFDEYCTGPGREDADQSDCDAKDKDASTSDSSGKDAIDCKPKETGKVLQ